MLHANFMKSPNDRPLEQRESTLDGVCVDIAPNPLVGGVVHALVFGFLVLDALVGFVVVGVDGFSIRGVFLDESMERFTVANGTRQTG